MKSKDAIAIAVIYGGSIAVISGGIAAALAAHLISPSTAHRMRMMANHPAFRNSISKKREEAWAIYKRTGSLSRSLMCFFE
jgi:hypothetical protein